MLTVNGVRWFSGVSCVGIVRCIDDHAGIKYYIGNASSVNEEFDAEQIMKWGAKFPDDAGKLIFGDA